MTITASELKYRVEATGSKYFTRENMRFAGDTMRNYGVRRIKAQTRAGDIIEVYELYRKKPVKHGLKSSAYFNPDTYRCEFIECEVQP